MLVLDGKLVSRVHREKIKLSVVDFKKKYSRAPKLAVVLVGDNPASQVYVRNKVRASEEVGIESLRLDYSSLMTQADLIERLMQLNHDDSLDGILVQLPLPKQCDETEINRKLSPLKDVDGLTFTSLGYLFGGHPLVSPCTPQGVMSILSHYQISPAGMHAVVVGRSQIVGKPMAQLLLQANATVTICHSQTKNLREICRLGDLVVVAAGQKQFLGREDFKRGAVVIDVGIHGTGTGGICGDVRYSELEGWVAAATPVPGGVGPMTITTLLENTVKLAEIRKNYR